MQVGDTVTLDDGELVRITRIEGGLFHYTREDGTFGMCLARAFATGTLAKRARLQPTVGDVARIGDHNVTIVQNVGGDIFYVRYDDGHLAMHRDDSFAFTSKNVDSHLISQDDDAIGASPSLKAAIVKAQEKIALGKIANDEGTKVIAGRFVGKMASLATIMQELSKLRRAGISHERGDQRAIVWRATALRLGQELELLAELL
jgi:hypothetical protein